MISECFGSVDFKKTGLLNNIQFFVMWRDLEKRWREQALLVRTPVPDRELAALYRLFNDFDGDS